MRRDEVVKAVLATLLGLVLIFPIYYTIAASFFEVHQFSASPPHLFPTSFSLHNYARALRESHLARFMFNSLFISTVGSVIRMA